MLERLRPLELRDERHVAARRPPPSAGAPAAGRPRVCTKLSATMSTPSDRPNCRSSTSFGVIADAGSATPGALMPLCSPSAPPSTTVVCDLACRRSRRRAARSGRRRAAADRPACTLRARPSNVVEMRPGPPTKSPVAMRERVARRRASIGRPPSSGRCGSSDRRDPAGSRRRGRRAPRRARTRANVARVRLVRAVREIQADDVDAGGDQRVEHRVGVAGRPDRGDDLGVPHVESDFNYGPDRSRRRRALPRRR